MDLGGTAKAATVASPESTVAVVEKACPATDVAEKPAASGKNGSVPDSSADSTKDSACVVADSPGKPKEVSKEPLSSPSPMKASDDVVSGSNSTAEVVKSPSKQPAVTTSTSSEKSQPESEPGRTDKPAPQHQDQIDEDDELLKRMEAIEKGEDLDAIPEDANHQNGTLEKTPEKKDSTAKTMDVGSVGAEKAMASPSVDASVGKPSETDAVVNPACKRKHPSTVEEEVEPQVKKVHIADVTDGPAESKATASSERQHSPAKQPTSGQASAEPPGPSEPDAQLKEEKPPSVEKMEVDGSPEPEASSPKDVELLPDTEPDAMDEKSEEISSSVVEEPMRQDGESAESSNKTDNSNVSSSDDKREGTSRTTSENPKPPDSEVSASVLPTPSGDEAMDVDEDENDVAESSSSTVPTPVASVPVPVVEPPCVKKVAYLCGEEDVKEADEKDAVVSTVAKSTASSTASSSTAPAKETSERMDVDSALKASSSRSVAVAKPVAAEPEDVVDSSNIVTTVPKTAVESVEKSLESVKVPAEEDSIVESSQPSSSSDTKKKQLTEPLREAVHRNALLAKATSTPNQTTAELTTPSSSNPSTPKSLNNPVTTSAVSSSNVYSSTPIHSNFGKVVSSGNVSKITNPPSSIESSRIEADETTTALTTTTTTTSSMNVTDTEEKSAAGHTTSPATKSLPSTSDTASSQTTTASAATSDSSAKSSASTKKELRHEDSSSSSKGSLKISGDVSEVDSCTASGMNTAEEINLYVSNARKLNGISSTSDGSELDAKDDMTKSLVSVKREDDGKPSISSIKLDLSRAISPTTSAEQQYEVSVWYEGKELQFMSVERIHGGGGVKATDPSATTAADTVTHDASNIDSSSKQSSTATTNGSVSSIGPFTLPGTQAAANATQSSDSSSSSSPSSGVTVTGVKSAHSITVPQMKQTVLGPKALCDLVIEEFKKLRRTFAPDDTIAADDDDGSSAHLLKSPKTPYGGRGVRKESAKKSGGPRGQKRSKAADSEEEDDDGGNEARTPRSSAGSASKQVTKRSKVVNNESPVASSSSAPKAKAATQATEPKQFDICCLARWTDRKYYAGRVTNYREDNKYVVVFEDGCSKTLSRDIIVFGEDGVLPIQHHSIHALTGGDTYEPAIVEEIKRNEANEVVYGVRTASSTLEVTATDIYLTDEQAKWIHNACKDKPDPIQKLLQSGSGATGAAGGGVGDATGGNVGSGPEGNPSLVASGDTATEAGEKGARSTRSKRGGAGAHDKSIGSTTPEAGYSGGVGKKGRRGRRKQLPPPEPNISECSDVSDTYEEETPAPTSPETGLDAVDGVQPELQRNEQESELTRMNIVSEYFGSGVNNSLDQLLGPIPVDAKTLFRNKHFLLSCTVPSKGIAATAKQFSNTPFIKQHLRRQIEAGGGKVYQFFEDVPKNKYKQCKLIAPRPSTTAMYVQCLASDIVAVSHEWIIQCCQVLMIVDYKPYVLPAGWSFLENRFIEWSSGRAKDKRTSVTPFASVCINVASLCKDFNDFWSRVCKLAGGTVRLIKTESDITDNLTGYLLTDQAFPEEIKIKAARTGLLVVSTVWVVQCLILGRVCHPKTNEKLTQIYQEEDY
ncbi:TP53-binding protein 1-like [Anopheles maculipalpis]|uniref:TP53-binding protein 1-like n=1 Tax=Anopheles maculipalpis TaxID=1496333 RepID=UPI0021596266|nr:TP53-binding protein 1-like [Anopheles maculipalpis]